MDEPSTKITSMVCSHTIRLHQVKGDG